MANWKSAVSEAAIVGKTHPDTFEAYTDIQLLRIQFGEEELP